ncbi:HAD family hydrolase [Bacillus paranthracis]
MNNNKLSIDQIKLVIFDMDGLMFDTERLGIEGWKYAFEHFGLPIPMSILIKKIGLNSVDSRKLFDEEIKYEFDYKSVKEVKREYVINYIREHGTPIKKGLLELLDFLDENNIKKVVATSRSEKMAGFYLSEAKIQHRFDAIITGDMVSKRKA